MKIIKISFVSILLALMLVVGFSIFYLGDVVKKGIQDQGTKILGVPVTVKDVDVSLIGGSIRVDGLSIGNPEGYKSERAIYLGQASIKFVPTSFFSDVIDIKHIRIIDPEINYEAKIGGTNINTIQKNIGGAKTEETSKTENPSDVVESDSSKPAKKVIVGEFLITGAKASAILNTGVKDVSKQVLLPEIRLENIGNDSEPASFKEVVNKGLSSLLVSLGKSDLSSISDLIGGQLRNTKDSVKEGVKKIEDKLKGLFN